MRGGLALVSGRARARKRAWPFAAASLPALATARYARSPQHTYVVPVAPTQRQVPAKTAVRVENDLCSWPHVAQPGDQQLEDGGRVLRRIDVARSQLRGEQLVAAEHIQRQEAVAVIVVVKEPVLLVAVQVREVKFKMR